MKKLIKTLILLSYAGFSFAFGNQYPGSSTSSDLDNKTPYWMYVVSSKQWIPPAPDNIRYYSAHYFSSHEEVRFYLDQSRNTPEVTSLHYAIGCNYQERGITSLESLYTNEKMVQNIVLQCQPGPQYSNIHARIIWYPHQD